MRLSALNIFSSWKARNAQQEQEVKENSNHPLTVWKKWEHRIWGNNISWFNWDQRRLAGHTTPLPKKGDRLWDRLTSEDNVQHTAEFEFVEVKYCVDPSDMWFATVKDIGYVEEKEGL